MVTLLKSAANNATRVIISPIYGAAEDIVKQAVIRSTADDSISSKLDSFTEYYGFTQNIAGCFMSTPTFTALITKLVRIHAELAIMNEAKFYNLGSSVAKKNEEAMPPSQLTGSSLDSSASSKHDEKKSEKKKEASISSVS